MRRSQEGRSASTTSMWCMAAAETYPMDRGVRTSSLSARKRPSHANGPPDSHTPTTTRLTGIYSTSGTRPREKNCESPLIYIHTYIHTYIVQNLYIRNT